jgi:hypothetical protein
MTSQPRFSIAILHKPGEADRQDNLEEMLLALGVPSSLCWVFDRVREPGEDFHTFKVKLFLEQWAWSLGTGAEHHIFLTDDLYLMPGFLYAVAAMTAVRPITPIGLLSNHPEASALRVGYWTNSWLVGPAYVLPHNFLRLFLDWYQALPNSSYEPGHARYFNDDSALNEFITKSGRMTWHPIPTIIEHRADLPSTVGHGDQYSRERVSWRHVQRCYSEPDGQLYWVTDPAPTPLGMTNPEFWQGECPFLPLPTP